MCPECKKSTQRSDEEKKYLKTRIKTLEGQMRGIGNMVDDDRYCNDILIQLLAINKSIKSLSNDILKSHLSSCFVEDIKSDNLEAIDEVMDLIRRLD